MRIDFEEILKKALREDIGSGDVTTRCFLPASGIFSGLVMAREKGIVCGTAIAGRAFKLVSKKAVVKVLAKDGTDVKPGSLIMTVCGDRGILTAERVALNFLQRLSGIATLTSEFVKKTRNTGVKILDTRKTTPGLRILEKYAVACGGGSNHRAGLYDMVLIKDNHLAGIRDIRHYGVGARPCPTDGRRVPAIGQGPAREVWRERLTLREELKKRITAIRLKHPKMIIEMEAQNPEQVALAVNCGVDIILLDNMPAPLLKEAIAMIRKAGKKPEIEISGGVNLDTVGKMAKLGPDRISVGRLTHSAKALDISFEVRREE
ncbi:MAG: nicotinate-nucleotide diphosphorylase [bacterium]